MSAAPAPTLDELRSWPATVSVPTAAGVLGISRTHAYELIAADAFPFRVLTLGARRVVVTSSIVDVLSSPQDPAA